LGNFNPPFCLLFASSAAFEPQNSLLLTPRLPIDGKPGECKQEAADGVVIAERTIGTIKRAEPMAADVDRTAMACGVNDGTETVADINETALLGREPAEMVNRVDEGDEERDNESQPQQAEFYCKESCQHDKNANANVPSAHELPLEGEWLVCASGEASDWNGDANASNAAIERVDSPSKSRVAKDTPGVESEGCKGGMSRRESVGEAVECCQQLCMADGDGDREFEPADTPNQSETLVIVSIKSESPDGGGILRVRLGSTTWHAGDANGAGHRTDVSRGQADGQRGWTDTLDMLNGAETAAISHDEGAGTYLDARGVKRVIDMTGGIGSQSDTSSGHWDVQSAETEAITPANATQIVSTPPKKPKLPDLPGEGARCAPEHPNGVGNHTDGSSMHTDTQSVGNATGTATNEAESVRMHQNGSTTQNSPNGHDIATPELPE